MVEIKPLQTRAIKLVSSFLKALFLLCFVSGLSISSASAKRESVTVQFHWLQQFEFAGFYMAKEKGFYRDAGLDVSFLPHEVGKTDVVDNVLTGKADFGVNYSSLIQNYHNKQPVVAIAALLQESPLVLMVSGNSDITQPEDLKDKDIMLGGDSLNSVPIMSLLFSHGLTRNEIRKKNHSHNIEDLVKGNTDAMSAFISNEPFKMQEMGYSYRIFDPKDINLSFYENFLFTSVKEIQQHPERVARFLKASLEGWEYAYEHIEETAEILFNRYNEQGKSYKSLVYEGYELRKLAYKEGVPLGDLDLKKLEKIEDAYRLMGINLSDKPINDFVWEGLKQASFYLNSKEQQFVKNTVINAVSTTNWVPISYVDPETGNPQGIGFDFWREIVTTARLNTHISLIDDFSDVLQSIENRTQDVITNVGVTEDREKYAVFSDPYASFPISIATSKDENFIQSVEELRDKLIVVGNNYTSQKMMAKAYPDLDYLMVENAREGLEKVSKGEAFGYVDILPGLAHSIDFYGFTNLKISGNTGLKFDLRLMIRDDYPELVSIVNKVIDSMDSGRKQQILNKWSNVRYEQSINLVQYWPYFSLLLLGVAVVMLWQHKSKQTAQLANIAKSEFLATMSHEIRTPMTSILGFSDLLLDDELPDSSREKVLQIKESTHALLHVVNDILDMSKLESGKMDLEKLDFSLKKMVSNIAMEIRNSHLKDKPVALEIEFSEDFPEFINSDPKRIRQILINLLGNAAKFTFKGAITLSGSVFRSENVWLIKIAIKDTGIGIKPDIVKVLFSPFTQADASISRRFEGSGLGLAICKRLTDLLKGKIGVESVEHQGSCFWFTFPFEHATKSDLTDVLKHPSAEYKTNRKLNLLLAEDNRVNQIIIKKMVTSSGHQVSIVNNGLEAVNELQVNDYDLILMDIHMPEMNGTEATRAIRQMSGKKSLIPIIAITADVIQENIEEYLASGITAYVHKPIDKTRLLQQINHAMGEAIHAVET